MPAIVIKYMLILAQRAGFLDPLKHLRVSNLETLVHVLTDFDHLFVKTITDALEKYEGSLSPSTVSTNVFNALWNFQGVHINFYLSFFFVSWFVFCDPISLVFV